MNKSLKVLGLVLVAALTLGASSPSSAFAVNPQFHGEAEHTTVSGAQEVRNVLGVNAGSIHCATATFHGTQTSKTTSEWTIAPSYSGCKLTSSETVDATVHMSGCHYLLTANGEVHLTCPSAPIRVTAPLCTITVHPQTIHKVDYINGSEGGTTRKVTVTATATNIAYTQSTFCQGGNGPFNNGTYSGSVATACTDTSENHVGCWWATE